MFLVAFTLMSYYWSLQQLFQLYNAYTLYRLSFHPECTDWQVGELFVSYSLCPTSLLFVVMPPTSFPGFLFFPSSWGRGWWCHPLVIKMPVYVARYIFKHEQTNAGDMVSSFKFAPVCTALPTLLGQRTLITCGLHGDTTALICWKHDGIRIQ